MMKGRIIKTLVTSNISEDYVSLEITDQASCTNFLSVQISIKDFGKLMACPSLVDCEFDLRPDCVGKTLEVKEEIVTLPKHDYVNREEVALKALEPFNVDGWRANVREVLNHHNIYRHVSDDGSSKAKVIFTRYV